jgi:ubiquinone/menaquinone biosynthesis C-methylase UbiE
MPNKWKQKQSAMRHYDLTSETYDHQYTEEQDLKIAAALEALAQPIDENAVILDAGCGTGMLFLHAQKARLAIGIDLSTKLLGTAKAKTKTYLNIALIRADADFLPFKAQIFTHAFAFTLLQNAPNPHSTLREIRRVTLRDAPFVITGLRKSFTKIAFTRLLEKARLEVLALKTDNGLKDFVAVCQKRP